MTYYASDMRSAAVHTEGSRYRPASSGRAQIMEQLGLHPSAQVDGLMTIFRCASNTSALRPSKLVSLLRAERDGPAMSAGQAMR